MNKFGMFIHWGIYAATELQEQAIARYNIPREEYEAIAKTFDPYKYDPEEWVLLAKKCGMKYICFTTKHHDGFCMWDTKYTDYKITNTPLAKETSLKVTKQWDVGLATGIYYDNLKITVKLFANGKDTGRTLTLSLKNGWSDTFRGLPYEDENGVPIVYTVGEGAIHEDWEPIYGEVITVPGTVPTYETTVTNSYRYGHGYELPSTGGIGRAPLILCGLTLMVGSLVCGYVLTRKRERRRRE